MFSANKITGMTVVLSETLKEIIKKTDTAIEEHPYSIRNIPKTNKGTIKYIAHKPWEHVNKGEKPPDAGLYPGSGYTGHVPGARETHGASFQSSLKLAQRATMSNTIRAGDHYADGGHFVSSATLGSLAGGQKPSMPSSVPGTARSREARLAERRSARNTPSVSKMESLPAEPASQPCSRQSTARSRASDGAPLSRRSGGGISNRSAGGRSNRSSRASARGPGTSNQESQVKNMFDKLPPSRQEAILQELSSGWMQNP